jgi:hypothetical protein
MVEVLDFLVLHVGFHFNVRLVVVRDDFGSLAELFNLRFVCLLHEKTNWDAAFF